MAKLDPAEFEGVEIRLVFLARTIREAERVEDLLTENQIEFTALIEYYLAGVLFTTERAGIGFYVKEDHAPQCRQLLRTKFKAGIVEG